MVSGPSFESFEQRYQRGEPQLVFQPVVADLETTVGAMIKLTDNQPYSFMFESVEQGAIKGRYSFIGMQPDLIWRYENGVTQINRQALAQGEAFQPCPVGAENGPLASLKELIAECQITIPEGLPPMSAGLFGYMGYDMVRHMERLPNLNGPSVELPDSVYSRPTLVVVFDHIKDQATLATPVWPCEHISASQAFESAFERLQNGMQRLARHLSEDEARPGLEPEFELPEPQPHVAPETYQGWVRRAKEYILAGDIFQVVLAQRFSLPFPLPAFSLYRSLRRVNPSPYMFHLNFPGYAIVGASPEILVGLKGRQVTIRPIAGTRPRGKTAAEDERNRRSLMRDAKELAEHLMLLDLGRNDVGRVSEIGSVKVPKRARFFVEFYSHVMHIVSNVTGKLRKDKTAIDALSAGFPAGTVSGAPKVRAMEIIEELEEERRGFYAGCVGYFAANGDMDNCIALRTCLIKDGTMHITAGAGIVADSDPISEHNECVFKSMALVRSAQDAIDRAQSHRRNA